MVVVQRHILRRADLRRKEFLRRESDNDACKKKGSATNLDLRLVDVDGEVGNDDLLRVRCGGGLRFGLDLGLGGVASTSATGGVGCR